MPILKNNKYSTFLLRLGTLILLVALFDLIIGNLLRYYYFRQIAGEGYRTTYAIDSTTADILIFGSSRANHHYVPEIFEDTLKISFYNTGRDGNFLLYNFAVFKVIMNRYTPKIVVFDISSNDYYFDDDSYDRLSLLLPYYRDHPEIRDIVNLRSPYEKFKLISSIYPFNSSLLTIGIGNMEWNKERKSGKKGYVPLNNYMIDSTLKKIISTDGIVDNNIINAINEIVKYCIGQNICLFFIQSPIFAIVKPSEISNPFELMAEKNNVEYWNYSNDPNFICCQKYFQDQNHLNEIGANYFSRIVANRIKKKVSQISLQTNQKKYIIINEDLRK